MVRIFCQASCTATIRPSTYSSTTKVLGICDPGYRDRRSNNETRKHHSGEVDSGARRGREQREGRHGSKGGGCPSAGKRYQRAVQSGIPKEEDLGKDDKGVGRGHGDQDEEGRKEGWQEQGSFLRTGRTGEAKDQGTTEKGGKEGGFLVLPVAKRPRNDRALPQGEVGGIDSDRCWWCNRGRQSRDHLFKECTTWKKEITELWNEVGRISGRRGKEKENENEKENRDGPFQEQEGLRLSRWAGKGEAKQHHDQGAAFKQQVQ